MGVHHLWTFFSRRFQPLCQRATKMWPYPGPSCPDCPFFKELSNAEINTWIHRVLAYEANLNPRAGPAPLREGVNSTMVSPVRIFLPACAIYPIITLVSLRKVLGMLVARRGASTCPRMR
jgi:hypothetical protein